MRFSLLTLLLIATWIATVMLVWVWREPWVLLLRAPSYDALPAAFRTRLNSMEEGLSERFVTPDGARYVLLNSHEPFKPVFEIWSNGNELCSVECRLTRIGMVSLAGFATGDDLVIYNTDIQNPAKPTLASVYHRRFPEWWWGHFYRPEVWALIVFSVLLGGMLVRKLLQRRTASG
jgi:hypothetical protein